MAFNVSHPLESDWKEYKRRLDEWLQRYLDNAIAEGVRLLTADTTPKIDRLDDARVHLKKAWKFIDETFDDFRRSTMVYNLMAFYANDIIGEQDLAGFSEDLRSRIIDVYNEPHR